MSKNELAGRLDWGNLLGFSNIREVRGRSPENLGAKVGTKDGQKPNGVSQLGSKIGVKLGQKPQN